MAFDPLAALVEYAVNIAEMVSQVAAFLLTLSLCVLLIISDSGLALQDD